MALPFFNWSRTAASNASADSTVNWAEGQAPSTVNDSARAMMASTAAYRDDVAGGITTGGTSTAYTVTSYQVFDTLAHLNLQKIAFIPHTTSGATVTLNVDGLGAKALRFAPSVELPAGTLIQGTPYIATYVNADNAFYLMNSVGNSPTVVPIGGMIPYAGSSAPNSNWVLPFGQAISRSTYATLFSLVSTTFGTGDGSTTFNIPDLRGRVPAGLDNMGGSAASRIGSVSTDNGTISGTTIGSTGGSSTHVMTTGEMPTHNHAITDPGHTHSVTGGQFGGGTNGNATAGGVSTPQLSGAIVISSATTGITINNNGSSSAFAMLQPTIIMPWIMRVL